ncbi:MutT/NUDIX family protein [Gongronella butleri]|nr:MutT/NUDIX family protein [Gongronella butleri]
MSGVATRSLADRLKRFTVYKCGADLSHLSQHEHAALKHLVKAAKVVDDIWYRQIWSGATALREKINQGKDEELKELFDVYKGPWAGDDHEYPFVPGVPERPAGANYYPEDMTKEEFVAFLDGLSPEDAAQAKSFYTVIRRKSDGKGLKVVPYAEEYKDLLAPLREHLLHAAEDLDKDEKTMTQGTSVAQFLRSRADAFVSNDYTASELDWLRLCKTNNLEITLGPYETYADTINSAKSSYECYIAVRDPHASDLLEKFADLQYAEDHLPVPEKYKNTKLTPAPISVVNQLYAGGDVSVPMTAAFNLPNDESVIKKGGSKLVLIKNVQEGKFQHVLVPIADQVLCADQLAYLDKNAFTTHILLHEVCHSNGPHETLDGHSVRSKMKEHHSAFEEAKADIAGLFVSDLMVKKGVIDDVTQEQFWVTFLASAFRSIRFGIQEAHGFGQVMQLNYLIEKGGVTSDAEHRFRVDFDKIRQAVSDLTRDILILQGDGDKDAVDAFAKKYGSIEPATRAALDRIDDAGIPVDIRPDYDLDHIE